MISTLFWWEKLIWGLFSWRRNLALVFQHLCRKRSVFYATKYTYTNQTFLMIFVSKANWPRLTSRFQLTSRAGVLTDRGRNSDAQPFGKMQMIQGTMLLLLCPEVARKKCLGMSLITVDFKRAYSLLVEGPAGERRGYCLLIQSG